MEITVLVCRRVCRGAPGVRSTMDACASCDAAVWRARQQPESRPRSLHELRSRRGKKGGAGGEEVEAMPPTEEQRREIERYIEEEG